MHPGADSFAQRTGIAALFFQADACSEGVILSLKHDSSIFQRPSYRLDVGRRTAFRSQGFHTSDGMEAESRSLGELRPTPIEQAASSPHLACGNFQVVIFSVRWHF